MNEYLERYKLNGFGVVEGWCSPALFEIMDFLDGCNLNRIGGCLEIGVHHGKFFILMNSLIEPPYKSYALDLFENQALNVDKSGRGNKAVFEANLARYDRHRGSNTVILSGDSTDAASQRQLRGTVGPLRFISIDGGHSAEHTVSDLRLATELIANEGIVILDDILNRHWLGVMEGTVIFLTSRPTLVPLAIGNNKLLLCKVSFHQAYSEMLRSSSLVSKATRFFGYSLFAL